MAQTAGRGGKIMTEDEYNYLLTLYLSSDYCEVMPFYEYVSRYGKRLIEEALMKKEESE
jgi:hypothetical protein